MSPETPLPLWFHDGVEHRRTGPKSAWARKPPELQAAIIIAANAKGGDYWEILTAESRAKCLENARRLLAEGACIAGEGGQENETRIAPHSRPTTSLVGAFLLCFLLMGCESLAQFGHFTYGRVLACELVRASDDPQGSIELVDSFAAGREDLQHKDECNDGCQRDLKHFRKGAQEGVTC